MPIKQIEKKKKEYSKASRYTASSCTDLDSTRFWIGSKKPWDARFLINCYEMHVFWEARILKNIVFSCTDFDLILLLQFHSIFKVFLIENYSFHASITYARALSKLKNEDIFIIFGKNNSIISICMWNFSFMPLNSKSKLECVVWRSLESFATQQNVID